ncbi:MAG: hypothetical protein NVS1B11_31600 [Terriglobales bacterium]
MSEELRWQDEILQMMYWMRGEHLGAQVSSEELNRLLQLTSAQLESSLARLIESGLVSFRPKGDVRRFELTASGIEEGRRRFTEEFSPYLGREEHLECSDPNCDCHSPEFAGICKNLQ